MLQLHRLARSLKVKKLFSRDNLHQTVNILLQKSILQVNLPHTMVNAVSFNPEDMWCYLLQSSDSAELDHCLFYTNKLTFSNSPKVYSGYFITINYFDCLIKHLSVQSFEVIYSESLFRPQDNPVYRITYFDMDTDTYRHDWFTQAFNQVLGKIDLDPTPLPQLDLLEESWKTSPMKLQDFYRDLNRLRPFFVDERAIPKSKIVTRLSTILMAFQQENLQLPKDILAQTPKRKCCGNWAM